MIGQCDKLFAAGDAEAGTLAPCRAAQPEGQDHKAGRFGQYSFRATAPRFLLAALVCGATLAAGLRGALASDKVPYRDAYQLQIVSTTANPDGTRDQIYAGQGTGTYVGLLETVILVHIEATEYDPASNSFQIQFSGTETLTAANGDQLFGSFAGVEYLPLDANFNVLPPPFHLEAALQITGGTAQFKGATGSLTLSGLDYNNGIISITSQGTISSVGANKTQ